MRNDDFTDFRQSDWRHTRAHQRGPELAERLRTYLRSLTAEHWLLFFAGLVIGLILG